MVDILRRLFQRPSREVTPDLVEEILALRDDGWTVRQIAAELRLPTVTVHRVLVRHGRTGRPRKEESEAGLERYVAMAKELQMIMRVAQKLGESADTDSWKATLRSCVEAIAPALSATAPAILARLAGQPAPPVLPAPDGHHARSDSSGDQAMSPLDQLLTIIRTRSPEEAAAWLQAQPAFAQVVVFLRLTEPQPQAAQEFLARARLFAPQYGPVLDALAERLDWFCSLLRVLRGEAA